MNRLWSRLRSLLSGANLLLAYEAVVYALLVMVATGLVAGWGVWYSMDSPHAAQTAAFMRGDLALSRNPADLKHDHAWSRGGVHQVWGLGIPLWRLPFDAVARWGGLPRCPDRLPLAVFMALTAFIVLRTFVSPLLEKRWHGTGSSLDPPATRLPLPPHTFGVSSWSGALGAALLLLAFPPFISLLQYRGAVYEEVLAYVYLYGLLLICGVVAVVRQPSMRRYWLLCALAGFGGFIRPTLVLHGTATVIVGYFVVWRHLPQAAGPGHTCRATPLEGSSESAEKNEKLVTAPSGSGWFLQQIRRRWRLAAGLAIFIGGGALLWWTNLVRFGSGFEFGHSLNMQDGSLLGSIYATRFDHPYAEEPWWRAGRELFGSLFFVRRFSAGDWYAEGLFWGQSPTLRWREFYFTAYHPSLILPILAGWLVAMAASRRVAQTAYLFSLVGRCCRDALILSKMRAAKLFVVRRDARTSLRSFSEGQGKAAALPCQPRHAYQPASLRSSSTGAPPVTSGDPPDDVLRPHPNRSPSILAMLGLWSVIASVLLAVFYLRTPALSSRYTVDFAPALAIGIVIAWLWLTDILLRPPRGRWLKPLFLIALLAWLGWMLHPSDGSYGPPRSATLDQVTHRERPADTDRSLPSLPEKYAAGESLRGWGIPYNGAGWATETGNVSPVIILFVDSPTVLVLELTSDETGSLPSLDHVRAKVGLELLERQSVEQLPDGWRLIFSGPERRQYQHGVQAAFIALLPNTELSQRTTPWRLTTVSWRRQHTD